MAAEMSQFKARSGTIVTDHEDFHAKQVALSGHVLLALAQLSHLVGRIDSSADRFAASADRFAALVESSVVSASACMWPCCASAIRMARSVFASAAFAAFRL
jgi:hypothetical protein